MRPARRPTKLATPAVEAPAGFLSPRNAAILGVLALGVSAYGYRQLRSRSESPPSDQPETLFVENLHREQSKKTEREILVEIGEAETIGLRKEMEDTHIAVKNFREDPRSVLLAVFDGHGGVLAAEYLRDNFAKYLADELAKTPDEAVAFHNMHKSLDQEVMKVKDYSGATSTAVLIVHSLGEVWIYAANAGDGRAVLCRKESHFRLTRDHKPSDADEKRRIIKAGGKVENGYIINSNLVLAVSRAFGDDSFKISKPLVIVDPDTSITKLEDGDDYAIVACDGLWDVVTDEEACSIARGAGGAQAAADTLVAKALEKGSTDNITVVVAKLVPVALSGT